MVWQLLKLGWWKLKRYRRARWKEVQEELDDAKQTSSWNSLSLQTITQPNQAVRDGDGCQRFPTCKATMKLEQGKQRRLRSVDTYIAPSVFQYQKDGKNRNTQMWRHSKKIRAVQTTQQTAVLCVESLWLISWLKDEIGCHQQHQKDPKNLTVLSWTALNASSLPSVDTSIINNTFVRRYWLPESSLCRKKQAATLKQWYNLLQLKKIGNHQ